MHGAMQPSKANDDLQQQLLLYEMYSFNNIFPDLDLERHSTLQHSIKQ